MIPGFQRIKQGWFWLASEEVFTRFEANPRALGYELLRRLPQFLDSLNAALCSTSKTWRDLRKLERESFWMHPGLRAALAAAGLHKEAIRHLGKKGISFNCALPANYILDAVREYLQNPPCILCAYNPGKSYKIKLRCRKRKRNDWGGNHTRMPNETEWRVERHEEPEYIYLRFPMVERRKKKPRFLYATEIFAFMRTFLKNKPPKGFHEYRSSIPRQIITTRSGKAMRLTCGLMALDYLRLPNAQLTDLADWLSETHARKGKMFSGYSQAKILKALYNGKASVDRVFRCLA